MAVDYSTLIGAKTLAGSIKNLVNYELVDPATVLTEAQAYIYGALRSREMRATAAVSITAGASTAALPTDLLEPIKLMGPYGELPLLDEADFIQARYTDPTTGDLDTDDVTCYAIFNEALNFDVEAESTTACTLLYWKRPADLASTTNETNWLTTRYPNLLLAVCRFYAYLSSQENDGEASNWKKISDELIARANIEADMARKGVDYMVRAR